MNLYTQLLDQVNGLILGCIIYDHFLKSPKVFYLDEPYLQ